METMKIIIDKSAITKSPANIPSIGTNLSRKEIVDIIRESRERRE